MMITRSKISPQTEKIILIKSRRRCCLCFWIDGIDKNQPGQIAHLDRKRNNNKEDNLCFLCLAHHDEYDTSRSQSKGLKISEVKHWRKELYKEMEQRFYTLEVERKLRHAKQTIRKAAHDGLILRSQEKPSRKKLEKWRTQTVSLVKKLAGNPAEFDFIHCTEGAGEIDLNTISGIRKSLNLYSDYLKELARTMDATDLNI